MQLIYRDRRRSLTSTTGTGDLTLTDGGGAWTPLSEADFGANAFAYTAAGGAQWETGIGHLSGSDLVRDIVLDSSDSGSPIDFSAGEKEVFCTFVADVADGVSELCQSGVAKPGRVTQTTTTDDTPATLAPPCALNPPFDETSNADRFGVAELYVLALSGSKSKSWRITFMIAPDGVGGATMFGKVVDEIAESESLTWGVDASLTGLDGINQTITLTGEAATTIDWSVYAAVKAGRIGTTPV